MTNSVVKWSKFMVPDNQQEFLTFLWENDGGLLNETQNVVMCAHVFGGTSSGSCLNCTLRRTIAENESIPGKVSS